MGELKFGDCRVVEELGSGSISTVYRAVQEPLGRTVAVKALKNTLATDSPFAAHLEREARLLAELSHPNIALLFDFVRREREMYLVLEYVEGYSLSKLLAGKDKLRPEAAAAIASEVLRALAHAHDRGIVHRDVKPANILVSKRGEVKIVDFSIAQRERMPSLDEPIGRADDITAFGTPAYMSPEQILGEYVDARSDLFSLGVVLYQMLAGARPFDAEVGKDRRAAAQRIRRDPPAPLRSRRPDVPRVLERLVSRLLEKLPADRYASAAAVADRLDDFVRDTSETAGRQVILRALVEAGLSKASGTLPSPERHAHTNGYGSVVLGFVALFVLGLGGAVGIQCDRSEVQEGSSGSGAPLPLAPANAGFLKVTATPWAEVSIDGQRVDVTPFARPLPLEKGEHHLSFSHPDAPVEKRVVRVTPGQTTSIDVMMNVSAKETSTPPVAGSGARMVDASVKGPR